VAVRLTASLVALAVYSTAIPLPVASQAAQAAGGTFECFNPKVSDGDTLRCGDKRIRLQGIDAPELAGHCRQGRQCVSGDAGSSMENLRRMVAGVNMTCRQTDTDRYGRIVARCDANGTDLSCAQVRGGFAVPRYAPIRC
jgi:endonuclease YncB( thermonuclease family)